MNMFIKAISADGCRMTNYSISLPTKQLGRTFCFSVLNSSELQGYEKLLKSSEKQKVITIAEAHLSKEQLKPFMRDEVVTPQALLHLIEEVNKVISFPIKEVGNFYKSEEFVHFRDNSTFINLPYSKKVSAWSDRNALQKIIREKFSKIFRENDLVVVPGCADGQIPIEVYANSLKHNVNLEIIAADFNVAAMQLGYLTMKNFGLNADRLHWVQTDIKSRGFFDWIGCNFNTNMRHQIVTLVQPSLREKSLLAFLAQGSYLYKLKHIPTTVIMPVLIEDKNSDWYRMCNNHVQSSLKLSEISHDLPQLMWNTTKYGHEMLRLDPTKTFYIPQQYFVRPEALSEIQEETGYLDFSDRIFDEVTNKDKYGEPGDPSSP